MKNSTILLFSLATLLLFSQALSSNRFLAQDDSENALNHPANASALHEDNRTHEHPPSNHSNNDSFPHHEPRDHESRSDQPHRPNGNHSHFDNTSAPQAADANTTRLLQNVNDTNATNSRPQGQRANGTHAHQPRKSKGHGRPGKQIHHQAGNHSNWTNASAVQPTDANATRLLANDTIVGERGNATHAVRPRASAPSRNETERARRHGRNGGRRAGGKGHTGNSTHPWNGENGEDGLENVTRSLQEALDKAFNQGNGKGKGQKHSRGRNHTNSGEDHFGGHHWNHENGEEDFHCWNITKKP